MKLFRCKIKVAGQEMGKMECLNYLEVSSRGKLLGLSGLYSNKGTKEMKTLRAQHTENAEKAFTKNTLETTY